MKNNDVGDFVPFICAAIGIVLGLCWDIWWLAELRWLLLIAALVGSRLLLIRQVDNLLARWEFEGDWKITTMYGGLDIFLGAVGFAAAWFGSRVW